MQLKVTKLYFAARSAHASRYVAFEIASLQRVLHKARPFRVRAADSADFDLALSF